MTLLGQGVGTRWPTEVPSNPDHSVWFCEAPLRPVAQIWAAGVSRLPCCLLIRGDGEELFQRHALPQHLLLFCCPQEPPEHCPCSHRRWRDGAAGKPRPYTWPRTELGNVPQPVKRVHLPLVRQWRLLHLLCFQQLWYNGPVHLVHPGAAWTQGLRLDGQHLAIHLRESTDRRNGDAMHWSLRDPALPLQMRSEGTEMHNGGASCQQHNTCFLQSTMCVSTTSESTDRPLALLKNTCTWKKFCPFTLNLIVQSFPFLHVTGLLQMEKWTMRQFLPQNLHSCFYCFENLWLELPHKPSLQYFETVLEKGLGISPLCAT